MTMTQLFEDEEGQQDTAWSFPQAFEYLMDGVEKSGDEIVQHIKDLLNGCPTDVMIDNFGRWGTIIASVPRLLGNIGLLCIIWRGW